MQPITKSQYEKALKTVIKYNEQLENRLKPKASANKGFNLITDLNLTLRAKNILFRAAYSIVPEAHRASNICLHQLHSLTRVDLIKSSSYKSRINRKAIDEIILVFKEEANIIIE